MTDSEPGFSRNASFFRCGKIRASRKDSIYMCDKREHRAWMPAFAVSGPPSCSLCSCNISCSGNAGTHIPWVIFRSAQLDNLRTAEVAEKTYRLSVWLWGRDAQPSVLLSLILIPSEKSGGWEADVDEDDGDLYSTSQCALRPRRKWNTTGCRPSNFACRSSWQRRNWIFVHNNTFFTQHRIFSPSTVLETIWTRDMLWPM